MAAANPAVETTALGGQILRTAETTPPFGAHCQITSTFIMVIYPSADEIRQHQRAADFAKSNSARSMAGQQRQSNPYLSQNQQDLLLAALNSQATGKQDTNQQASTSQDTKRSRSDSAGQQVTMNGSGVFMSPTEADFDNFGGDYTPDLDYLDGDNFDFENADLGGEMIGALPGDGTELHEKRKNSEDDDGDAKRQETQEGEKGSKKPGRKPLTSEPTTVSLLQFVHI